MNGIYVEDWKKNAEIVRAVLKTFTKWQIQMDYGIWCPHTWKGLKGETMCVDALLHVTMESQALQAWNCENGFTNFRKDLEAVASKRELWWEQGFHWSIHLYKK